jgi:hypothetical protein
MYMVESSWENLLAYKAHKKYIKQQDIKHIDLIRIDLTLVFLVHCGFSVTHDCTSDNGFSVVPFFNGFRI